MLAKNVAVLCLCPESMSEDEFTGIVVLSLTEKTHGKIVQANVEELSVIDRDERLATAEKSCALHWKSKKLFPDRLPSCFFLFFVFWVYFFDGSC